MKNARILNVGAGTSSNSQFYPNVYSDLSEEMFLDKYENIINIDSSQNAIDIMSERLKTKEPYFQCNSG